MQTDYGTIFNYIATFWFSTAPFRPQFQERARNAPGGVLTEQWGLRTNPSPASCGDRNRGCLPNDNKHKASQRHPFICCSPKNTRFCHTWDHLQAINQMTRSACKCFWKASVLAHAGRNRCWGVHGLMFQSLKLNLKDIHKASGEKRKLERPELTEKSQQFPFRFFSSGLIRDKYRVLCRKTTAQVSGFGNP